MLIPTILHKDLDKLYKKNCVGNVDIFYLDGKTRWDNSVDDKQDLLINDFIKNKKK